jgi:hypothetical protein
MKLLDAEVKTIRWFCIVMAMLLLASGFIYPVAWIYKNEALQMELNTVRIHLSDERQKHRETVSQANAVLKGTALLLEESASDSLITAIQGVGLQVRTSSQRNVQATSRPE